MAGSSPAMTSVGGLSARRASANIGHNPARMTFIARPIV
jgi:hypothetical protein